MPRFTIYIVLTLAIACVAYMARPWENLDDALLNIFAEAVGVLFTIAVIEQLIHIEERRRTRPARSAAFLEAQMVYGRTKSLWWELIQAAFDPERDAQILEANDLKLLDIRLGNIIMNLDLESDAPVIPRRSWRIHMWQKCKEIEKRIDKCLHRFAGYMEPELIRLLQQLERSSFFLFVNLLPNDHKVYSELGRELPREFGWGNKKTASGLIRPLRELGLYLRDHRSEFAGFPGIVDVIDIDGDIELKNLRAKVGQGDKSSDQGENVATEKQPSQDI